MQPLILTPTAGDPRAAHAVEAAWRQGRLVGLGAPEDAEALQHALGLTAPTLLALPAGPAVVVGSGGSSGRRRWCLQPLSHLRASAAATGQWLRAQGVEPASCLHLNPLPLHHVSGLLPLVRGQEWGAEVRTLPPEWLRHPRELATAVPLEPGRPVLLSLVPTQLRRFLADPIALAWLQGCRIVWVGGAPLGTSEAEAARQAGLPLAPCYGATETAAMVCALPPAQFLAGVAGYGPPLADVQLRLQRPGGALEVRCPRLSPGWLQQGRLQPLPQAEGGWWRSGDGAQLEPWGVQILGRLDGAIHSGGETVFPEVLEARLRRQAQAAGLNLQEVLLLGMADPRWGERLVALVRPGAGTTAEALKEQLGRLVQRWRPAERPRQWQACPELRANGQGKWERLRWRQWLLDKQGRG